MKSQISIEFIAGLIFLLIVYVASLSSFSSFAETKLIESEITEQTCLLIANSIDSGSIGGNGFSMNVTMDYQIDAEGNFLVVRINPNTSTVDIYNEDNFFSCTITTQNATNMLMYAGKFSINNLNDNVYVSAVLTDKLSYDISETVKINGTYFLNNISLIIENESGVLSGYPKTIQTTNNTFTDTFNPASKGNYKIKVNDINLPTFYAEREFEVR